MTPTWMIIASAVAVIGCGLVSGVFLAFSDFIMKSLAVVPPANGAEAMQIINRKVYRSVFLTLFMAMAALSLFLGAYALLRFDGVGSAWIAGASTLYLLGVFATTVIFNVPMNKRLDRAAAEVVGEWTRYSVSWTGWNHVRTITSTGAAIGFLIGVVTLN